MKNNKKLIISHVADIDGLDSVVVSKLVYPDIDYELVEFTELSDLIKSLVESKKYLEYNEIFITDVSIRNELIEYISNIPELAKRIKHFDHHASEMENNKVPFINIVLKKDDKDTCGTSLIYDYLLENNHNDILDFEHTKSFVESTRCRDNWLKNESEYALGCDLTELSIMYGNDNYISRILDRIVNNKPLVSENEKILIQTKYNEIQKYIQKCDESLIFMQLDGRDIGVSFSEQYRSEVGNALSKKYEEKIDYVLVINLFRGQYSFRTVRDDVDVSKIAKSFDQSGGGHPKASGLSINQNTIWIAKEALCHILDNENVKLVK